MGDASVREATRKGRAKLLAPFLSLTEKEAWRTLPAPDEAEAFVRCKLDFSEREKNRELYDFHFDLLKLRREDSRFSQQSTGGIDGAVVGARSFVFRYFSEDNDDRLLVVNCGKTQTLHPASEPLLAQPSGCKWETLWTTESPRYCGSSGCRPGARPPRSACAPESHPAPRCDPPGDDYAPASAVAPFWVHRSLASARARSRLRTPWPLAPLRTGRLRSLR